MVLENVPSTAIKSRGHKNMALPLLSCPVLSLGICLLIYLFANKYKKCDQVLLLFPSSSSSWTVALPVPGTIYSILIRTSHSHDFCRYLSTCLQFIFAPARPLPHSVQLDCNSEYRVPFFVRQTTAVCVTLAVGNP